MTLLSGGGSGGGLVLLDAQTASASASFNFGTGIDDTYDEYQLHFALRPASDNLQLRCLLSSNAGSTWDAGASDYKYQFKRARSGTTGFDVDSSSNASANLPIANNVGASTGEGATGILIFPTLRDTTLYKLIRSDVVNLSDVTEAARHYVVGARMSTAAFNGIQLIMQSGNIASGWARLYGVKKS